MSYLVLLLDADTAYIIAWCMRKMGNISVPGAEGIHAIDGRKKLNMELERMLIICIVIICLVTLTEIIDGDNKK